MSVPTAEKPRARLEFLDGLRGLAALYVVLFHAVYELLGQPMGPGGRALGKSLSFGHFAVDVFIVLSGFCLMMPVIRAGQGRLPKGFAEYMRRRARRILPPYYVALLFSAMLAAVSVFALHTGVAGATQFGFGPIVSHILLIHNFDFGWTCAINGPLWSVATEWQIYFLFPLLLLPVWRRCGNVTVVLVGLAAGLAPFYALPAGSNFWWAYPWFVGLFAMGMAAAASALEPARAARLSARCFGSWQTATCLFAVFIAIDQADVVGRHLWVLDVLAGLGTASLILYCARAAVGGGERRPLVLRVLESKPCVRLGAMSYSLYLVHYPLVRASYRLLQKKIHTPEPLMAAQLAVSLTFVVGLAYLFHLAFERRFMNAPGVAAGGSAKSGEQKQAA